MNYKSLVKIDSLENGNVLWKGEESSMSLS